MRLSAAQVEAMREADEARIVELQRELMRTDSFLDFQPRVSPHLSRRPDLAPIFNIFERAYAAAHGNGRPIIALVSAPPQVGKTSAGQHSCAGYLARDPTAWLFFITYNDDLAEAKSRDVRDYALRAGVNVRTDSSAVSRWQTKEGGGFLARGRSGGITGQSKPDLVWLDDPYKDRPEAESAAISEGIAEMVSGVIMTRRHPRTSVIISHTRWTTSDVIATTKAKLEGKIDAFGVDLVEVNLPCVDPDTGEPLITFGGRDRAFYDAQRLVTTDHDWWSLYMGAPRAREGKLFKGTHLYERLPNHYSLAIGMDLAYTAKTSGDWSAAVVLARDLDTPENERPVFYVVEALRARCTVEDWFTVHLARLRARYPSASLRMRTGGQEAALLETASKAHGVYVLHEPTRGSKYDNAMVPADDWCRGRILVPASASWDVGGFVARMLDVAGKGDESDDEMDAMVTAHKALCASVVTGDVARPAGRLAAARGGWL